MTRKHQQKRKGYRAQSPELKILLRNFKIFVGVLYVWQILKYWRMKLYLWFRCYYKDRIYIHLCVEESHEFCSYFFHIDKLLNALWPIEQSNFEQLYKWLYFTLAWRKFIFVAFPLSFKITEIVLRMLKKHEFLLFSKVDNRFLYYFYLRWILFFLPFGEIRMG